MATLESSAGGMQPRTLTLDADGLNPALVSLVDRVEQHDMYTGGHSRRVAWYAGRLAHLIGLADHAAGVARRTGLVHDIGKMIVPEHVLCKKGRLTDRELELMRLHPVLGANILSRMPGMDELAPGVLHHHERWDGAGYPRGLVGPAIPVAARLIFVVDAFDAMTTNRPYGEVLSEEEAMAEIERCSGSQFDPELVLAMRVALEEGLLVQQAAAPDQIPA